MHPTHPTFSLFDTLMTPARDGNNPGRRCVACPNRVSRGHYPASRPPFRRRICPTCSTLLIKLEPVPATQACPGHAPGG